MAPSYHRKTTASARGDTFTAALVSAMVPSVTCLADTRRSCSVPKFEKKTEKKLVS